MPPEAWVRMHAAIMSRRYSDAALAMSVAHPGKNPSATQKKLAKAAARALRVAVYGGDDVEVWRDPERMKAVLRSAGIAYSERRKEEQRST